MNKLDTIIAFIALGISTTILFQNCSAPNAKNPATHFLTQGEEAQNSENDFLVPPTENPQPEVPAGPIMNRNIPLDNKLTLPGFEFEFSTGGAGDVLTYETTYLAQTNSTVVRFQDAGAGSAIVVESDQCTGQKNLSPDEFDIYKSIFDAMFPSHVQERILIGSETQEPNCAFPRLVMSVNNPQSGDLELYLSSRECTPEGDLYLADTNNDNGDDIFRASIDAFFKGHIDDICGL